MDNPGGYLRSKSQDSVRHPGNLMGGCCCCRGSVDRISKASVVSSRTGFDNSRQSNHAVRWNIVLLSAASKGHRTSQVRAQPQSICTPNLQRRQNDLVDLLETLDSFGHEPLTQNLRSGRPCNRLQKSSIPNRLFIIHLGYMFIYRAISARRPQKS